MDVEVGKSIKLGLLILEVNNVGVSYRLKNTIFSLFLLSTGGLFSVFFYLSGEKQSFLKKINPNEAEFEIAKSIYPESFIKRMGSVSFPDKRIHHFLNYSNKAKKEGVLRVGLFGDSHTYSSEVDMRNSLAVFLSEKLNQSGEGTYEVLNFGLGGGSFHQSLFLFEKYHRDLQLDIIIFGPRGYQPERELSFHPFLNPFAPKNRFILNKDSVSEVNHPAWDNYQDRDQELLSFFPSLNYWKYERGLPLLYRVAFSNEGKNPFYYSKKSAWEESLEINSRLLEKMKDKNPQMKFFITFNKKRRFNNYIKRLSAGPLAKDIYLVSPRKKRLPYQRTDHASPFEIELISDAFSSLILNHKKMKRPIIKLTSQTVEINEPFSLKGASFISAGTPLGALSVNGYKEIVEDWPKEGIIFFQKGDFWGDGVFYPFPIDLIKSDKLSIEIDRKLYHLGHLEKLTKNIFLAELDTGEIDYVKPSLKGICLNESDFKFLSKKTKTMINVGGVIYKGGLMRGDCLMVFFDDFDIEKALVFKGPKYLEKNPRDLLPLLNDSPIFLKNDLGFTLSVGVVKLENP